MAIDARIRYTKMIIVEKFIELLKKTPINKITVKKICEMAEINRATFYKHYLDVYDVLENIENQFLDELRILLSSKKNNNVKDIMTLIMVSFKNDEEYYKVICSINGDPFFPSKVLETCYKSIEPKNNIKMPNLSPTKKEWLYQFIVHGCNGLLNSWFNNGMKEPISDVSDYVEELIKKVSIN